jgi:hypothetical protein
LPSAKHSSGLEIALPQRHGKSADGDFLGKYFRAVNKI